MHSNGTNLHNSYRTNQVQCKSMLRQLQSRTCMPLKLPSKHTFPNRKEFFGSIISLSQFLTSNFSQKPGNEVLRTAESRSTNMQRLNSVVYLVHFGSRSLFAVDLLINNSTSSVCFALLLVKSHESRAQTDLNQFSRVRFLITRVMVLYTFY